MGGEGGVAGPGAYIHSLHFRKFKTGVPVGEFYYRMAQLLGFMIHLNVKLSEYLHNMLKLTSHSC